MGARCGQRLWAGPRDWPLCGAHQPPAHIHPGVSARPSTALAVPLPRAAQPGQLNTWGPEAQKTGNGPSNHLCKFLEKKKNFFFFYVL